MSVLFAQTANHCIDNTIYSNLFNTLPDIILKHTDWDYLCQLTDAGCFLKPTFRNMPHRNSFLPEIDIVALSSGEHTILQMCGQPVKNVRVFMAIWVISLLFMELCFLALTVTSVLDSIFPVFIPIGLCAFGYLLCKLCTKAAFNSIFKAIQQECS